MTVRFLWIALAALGASQAGAALAPPLEEAIADKEYRRVEGVLVEQGGEIIYERYFRKSTVDSWIDARSAGKSITAMAVGRAIADGHISGVDALVFPYFEDMTPIINDGQQKQQITVRDLLTMTSALDCNDWDPKSVGNEERMYDKKVWTRFALDIPIADGYERASDGLGRYSYCTAGAFLLGRIVERAVGEPFDAYVNRILFEPLGVEDAQWTRSPAGEVQSGGQLSLRARDFAVLGRLILDRGRHGGEEILSEGWIKEMIQPSRMASPDDGYGYLWWARQFKSGDESYLAAYMSGNGGNMVAVFPDLDAVIVVLSTNYNRRNMHQQSTDIIEKHLLPLAAGKATSR